MSYWRIHQPDLELRDSIEPHEAPRLEGFAIVFDERTQLRRGLYEVIAPEAVTAELLAAADVRALVDHDPSKLLARQGAGTLELEIRDRGLHMSIEIPDTQLGRDTATMVRRGDLTGASFGFIPGKVDRSSVDGEPGATLQTIRTIDRLVDVSVVTFPAYDAASVQARQARLEQQANRTRLLLARHRARSSK